MRTDEALDFVAVRDHVLEALSLRLDRKQEQAFQITLTPVHDFWSHDREGESHLSASSYFGDSRRTLARDSTTDVGLSVLEASARKVPPSTALLEKARSLSDERLRWTAARLLEQLQHETPHHPDRSVSPEPAVQKSDL